MVWFIRFPGKNVLVYWDHFHISISNSFSTEMLICLSSLDHHLNSFADKVISWTTKITEASSANSLGFEIKLSERLWTNIKKKKGPRIDP